MQNILRYLCGGCLGRPHSAGSSPRAQGYSPGVAGPPPEAYPFPRTERSPVSRPASPEQPLADQMLLDEFERTRGRGPRSPIPFDVPERGRKPYRNLRHLAVTL